MDGMMAELGRVEVGGGSRSHTILLHRTGILASGTHERTFRGLGVLGCGACSRTTRVPKLQSPSIWGIGSIGRRFYIDHAIRCDDLEDNAASFAEARRHRAIEPCTYIHMYIPVVNKESCDLHQQFRDQPRA